MGCVPHALDNTGLCVYVCWMGGMVPRGWGYSRKELYRYPHVDGQTRAKALPSHNFVCGRYKHVAYSLGQETKTIPFTNVTLAIK